MMEMYLTVALIVSCLWAVICRIKEMDPKTTQWLVFFQHATLGMGLFGALILPPVQAKLALIIGVFCFLISGSMRWRHGAPEGTKKQKKQTKLHELPADAHKHVVGGVKK